MKVIRLYNLTPQTSYKLNKIMASKRFQLNEADLIAWGKNALWFLAPTLLVLIPSIVGVIPTDWKYAAIAIYLLNRVTDMIRRWYAGK